MLKQRIITAVILIPIVLAILFFAPPAVFGILTFFMALGGVWEWTNLMGLTANSKRFLYLILMTAAFFLVFYLPIFIMLVITYAWWLFATLLVIFYPRGSQWLTKSIFMRGLMGLFVLVPCWASLTYIRYQTDGVYAVLFLFILIWGADSAAYFVGKKWGKTKLAPKVSPGKSLQGALGALLYAVLVSAFILWISGVSLELWIWGILLALITIIFSIIGDLFESLLKRQVGLKDSGHFLPGHGGLLDRIDSLTAAAPIFALGGLLLGTYFG